MSERLVVASYNLGNGTDARVLTDLRNLLTREGVDIIGTQETGDRATVVNVLARSEDVTLLRKPKGAPNRVALILEGLDVDNWGVFPLNPGREPIERTVAGNGAVVTINGRRRKRAEPKFIVWGDVEGIRIGDTHYIPSSAQRTKLPPRRWRHPLARGVYRTQVARTVEWFEQGGDVLLMDANGVPGYDLLAPLAEVADIYDAPSKKKPRRIDKVCIRKGSGISVEDVWAEDDVSSDHPAIIARLLLPTPRKAPKPPEARAAGLIRTKLIPDVERAAVAALLEAAAAGIEDGTVTP